MPDPMDVQRAPLAMRPQGMAGRLFGVLMERINGPAYRRAVADLEPREGERFLEIGFGTGRLVELLLESAGGVQVGGVDPTATMVEVAAQRRGLRSAGARVDLRQGSDVPLPWPDASFDGAAALHCFQFWPKPAQSLQELWRVLVPGGRLLLVLRSHGRRAPAWLPNPVSRGPREVDSAAALLCEAGFEETRELAPVGSSRVLHARRAVVPAPPNVRISDTGKG